MKKIALIFLFACIIFTANSQQMQFDWITQAGGPGWDIVTDIAELPDGQIIITGTFQDSIYFNTDTLRTRGSRDIFIASYAQNGSLNNVVSFGGTGYDYVKKVEPSGESGVVVPIKFYKELEVDGQKYERIFSNNYLISWLDKSLHLTNHAQISSTQEFDIISLEAAPDGDFFFSGWFTDTLQIENKIYVSTGAKDIFLGKISKNGKLKWLKQFKGEGYDVPSTFIPGKAGTNFMTGITSKGCFGDKNAPDAIDGNMVHLFISEIKNVGITENVSYPAYGNNIEPIDMIKDSSFLWVLINFKHTLFMPGVEIVSYGKGDVLLLKYDLEKNTVDYCQLGGSGNEQANGLVKSGDQIVITGLFSGKLTFAANTIKANKNGTDIFIASINIECQPKNIFALTGESSEFPCSAFASESGIYITGEFRSKLKTRNEELTSEGEEDIFLARVENCSAKNPLKVTITSLDNSTNNEGWELDAGAGFIDYSWNDSTSASRYFIVSIPDVYTVEVTDSLGCIYKKDINLSQTKSAQIKPDEKQPEQGFKLYPSITSGLVYWEPSTSWEKGKTNVRVFDSSGKQTSHNEINKMEHRTYQIDFSSEPEGTYIVEVSGTGFREISKVMVKK